MFENKNYLCLKGSPSQWFSLHPVSRGYFAMTLSPSFLDDLLSPCFSESQSGKIKLLSQSFSPPISDHDTTLEEWVDSSVHWNKSIEATAFVLDSNSLKFVVDGTFFLEWSILLSDFWKCFSDDILLNYGYFASATEFQCINACLSELCGYLSIFKFVEWLQSHSERTKKYALEIGAHCASVVNRLSYFPTVTTSSTFLHQVADNSEVSSPISPIL